MDQRLRRSQPRHGPGETHEPGDEERRAEAEGVRNEADEDRTDDRSCVLGHLEGREDPASVPLVADDVGDGRLLRRVHEASPDARERRQAEQHGEPQADRQRRVLRERQERHRRPHDDQPADDERAAPDAVREGALFNYNMFAYLDGDFLYKAVAHLQKGGKPDELKGAGVVPDMMKRGTVRAIYDGRYVYARYFSPKQHNRPASLESLFGLNDVELFDLARDPNEAVNLAADRARHGELLLAMNDKLNKLIDAEVGDDVGQMLPGGVDGGWVATDAVRDV